MSRLLAVRAALVLAVGLACACGESSPLGTDGGAASVRDGDSPGSSGSGGSSGAAADGGADAFAVEITASRTTVCPGQCVDLTATAQGGVAPYSFRWDHGLGASAHAERACPTETTRYTVTADDSARDDEFSHDHPPVSASVEVAVASASACLDGELIDAGSVPPDSLEVCTFRGQLTGGGLAEDMANKHHQSLVDSHGELVISGSFSGVLDVGGKQLAAGGSLGGYVIKLDASCNVVWARVFASDAGSALWIAAIARDAAGHVYVAGGFSGKTVLGDSAASQASGFAGFLLQLDSDGNDGWSKVYESNYAAVAVTDLVTDAQHRLTFVGYAGFDTNLGGGPLALLAGTSLPFIAQLDTAGTFGWSRAFNDPDLLYGLANGPYDDSLVLTGWATSTIDLGKGPLALGKGGRFLAKLNSLGQVQWQNALPRGADLDQWNWWKGGVGVDTWGKIVVLRDEPETLPGDSGERLLDDSVEQYTIDGAPAWQTRLSPASAFEHEWGNALALFSDSHALRFGSFMASTAYAGSTFTSRGGSDVALVELSDSGEPLWAYQLGAALDDRVLGVAVDFDNHIFASYGSITDASDGDEDLVMVKLRRP